MSRAKVAMKTVTGLNIFDCLACNKNDQCGTATLEASRTVGFFWWTLNWILDFGLDLELWTGLEI